MATQVKTNLMQKPPPGEPWEPVVRVILHPDTETFEFESDDLHVGPNNEITFSNEGQPGFIITFRLAEPRYGYQFPEDEKFALWSTNEEVCPDDEGQWGQFKGKAVNNNGTDLVVRNLNEKKRKFGYALLVTKDHGNSFWRLDPIGNNDNGSSRGVSN